MVDCFLMNATGLFIIFIGESNYKLLPRSLMSSFLVPSVLFFWNLWNCEPPTRSLSKFPMSSSSYTGSTFIQSVEILIVGEGLRTGISKVSPYFSFLFPCMSTLCCFECEFFIWNVVDFIK